MWCSNFTCNVIGRSSDLRHSWTFDSQLRCFSRFTWGACDDISRVRACAKCEFNNNSLLSLHGPRWGDFRWAYDAKEHLVVRIKRIVSCRCRNFVQRLGASRLRESFLKRTVLLICSHFCARCSVMVLRTNSCTTCLSIFTGYNSCDWSWIFWSSMFRRAFVDICIPSNY